MDIEGKQAFIAACRSGTLCPKGMVGLQFERNMFPRRFRDLITFYHDGRVRFERYCFGEAAGLICGLWAKELGADGSLNFQSDGRHYAGLENAPAALLNVSAQGLFFDNTKDAWPLQETLRADPKNGYRRLSLFRRRLRTVFKA